MFEIGIAIGIFSYLIFFIGLAGLLYAPFVIIISLLFWGGFVVWKRQEILLFIRSFHVKHTDPWVFAGVFYLVLQALINSIGLLGPEIGFDATWYHLTLPKLYLAFHAIFHIPGTVLYYSDMPKLTEMLYTAGLSFGSDFFARGIHFLFGILTCVVLYKIGKKFFSPTWAILLPVIFYSSLVVGWESISAYIDLARTFFAALALFAFLDWTDTKEKKLFVYAAIFVGLTITTKLLALPDIALYAVVIYFVERNLPKATVVRHSGIFAGIALLCPLPWLVFAYIHTGDPFYPLFSKHFGIAGYTLWNLLNPVYFLQTVWSTFGSASDPLHPIFLALLPFFLLFAKKIWKEIPLVALFAVGGLGIWYITPQTGGGRYILPYLTPLSVVAVFILTKLSLMWKKVFLSFIVLVAALSLGYRGIANAKVIPLLTHKETMAKYMQAHLQFNLGDFYDTDGYFASHIKPTDVVLLYGFHNLYYVDFPYIDSAWVRKGDWFNYVAVQGSGMPKKFMYWNLVYFNPVTHVRLYSVKGHLWRY